MLVHPHFLRAVISWSWEGTTPIGNSNTLTYHTRNYSAFTPNPLQPFGPSAWLLWGVCKHCHKAFVNKHTRPTHTEGKSDPRQGYCILRVPGVAPVQHQSVGWLICFSSHSFAHLQGLPHLCFFSLCWSHTLRPAFPSGWLVNIL